MNGTDDTGGSSAALFDALVVRLVADLRVEEGTGFGRMPGLRTNKKIFAMLCRGELVVKLPQERVDLLVAGGVAERFDARGDGRRMKEWASISPAHDHDWHALAVEAFEFVSTQS